MADHWRVDFEPLGRRGDCPAGATLLDCARLLGVDLANLCGGSGLCGRCRVQIVAGQVTAAAEEERALLSDGDLANGYRLACRAAPLTDCRVRVPAESLTAPQRTQVEGAEVPVAPEPPVRFYPVELLPTTLSAPDGDWERITGALQQVHGLAAVTPDLAALRQASDVLRLAGEVWQASVAVRGREVIGVAASGRPRLGLAVDLGTTKIAGYLMDLATGKVLHAAGVMNPQIAYGEDVISRLTFVLSDPKHGALLASLTVDTLNQLAGQLAAEAGAAAADIWEMVVVGNTAMHHLLLGLPVGQLAAAPYAAAVRSSLDVKARDLGLRIAAGACVHLPPNVAGFVGSDHVAIVLAARLHETADTVLALDIGTNTEICLAHAGGLTSLSCASGPAFEGAHIEHGMRAAPGAVERVRIVDGRVEWQTVGGLPPVGTCGSGLLDAVAAFCASGIVDETGRMHPHSLVRGAGKRQAFVLVDEAARGEGQPALTISQRDVCELQLAKAAIRTGIDVLLHQAGIGVDAVERVVIAGAFGSYIDVASAMVTGLLPRMSRERVVQVGNAAGMGAKLCLASLAEREAARALGPRIGYIELAGHPLFAQRFAKNLMFESRS